MKMISLFIFINSCLSGYWETYKHPTPESLYTSLSESVNKETQEAFLYYIYIFILFRFFDIKKPFPVNFFDKKYKNSFGVIIDDVVAGLYTVITLIIFMIIKSKFF